MDDGTNAGGRARSVDAGRGVTWWSEAWSLFTKNIGMWIVLALVMLVIFIVLNFVPIVGPLAASLVAPAFAGSWMLAARKVDRGGALEVSDLFGGFRDKFKPLLVIGALLLAATIVIFIVVGVLGVGAMGGMIASGSQHSAGGMMAAAGTGLLAMLVAMVLGFAVALAIWFAPALVVFRDMAPVDALKASVSASVANLGPFLVYGLLYLVASIVASIPFGLGWIVLLPVTVLTVYVSYKDVFEG